MKLNYHTFLGSIVILLISFFGIHYTGGDSTFPIINGNFPNMKDVFLYIWSDGIFGTTTIIEKLRIIPALLLNELGIYYKNIYYIIFNLIGFFSFYFFLKKINQSNDYSDKNRYIYVVLSLLFVVNPLTIGHTDHTFILQGYLLYPFIGLVYLKYLDSKKIINIFLVLFLIGLLGLGQPHNYFNVFYILLGITCYILLSKKFPIHHIFIRVLILCTFTIIFFSFIIFPFIGSIPNELTSSVSNFSNSEPNMVWSNYQGITNTLVFKKNILQNNLLSLGILTCINGFFLLVIFFIKDKFFGYFKSLYILLISLTFIGTNPLLAEIHIKDIIYLTMPHLRVDISYVMLLYVPFFYLLISRIYFHFSITIQRFFLILLSITLCINIYSFIIINNLNKNNINIEIYKNFTSWLDQNINNGEIGMTYFYPKNVTYNFPGLSSSIYAPIAYSNIAYNNHIYNWDYKELTISSTKKFLEMNDSNLSFLNKTYISSILCSSYSCQYFAKDSKFTLKDTFAEYSIFNYKDKLHIILANSLAFLRVNPTQYRISIRLDLSQNFKFLQSFHPGWKLYLEPFAPLDCGSDATAYSGATDISTGKMLSGATYIVKSRDDYARIARAYTGLTVEDLVVLNPNIDPLDLKIGMEIGVSLPTPEVRQEPYHVTECPSQNTFYAGGELAKLWEKPIFDDTHRMVYDYANQWTIDPEYIKANYSREYYRINPDGTTDVRMTMYFRPQSYFYLGLIISGLTLLACLGCLTLSAFRGHRRLAKGEKLL